MYLKLIFIIFACSFSSLFSCQVIYLNGTSSVGKTTIAKALQDEMDVPYLRIGIDQIISYMPEKINNWEGGKSELGFSWKNEKDLEGHSLQILQMGPFAKRMPELFREMVLTMLKSGFNVIIDDVASECNAYEEWRKALKGYQVLWVGLTAPIDEIEKREISRGDRQIGQARAASKIVHQNFKYDLFIDTHSTPNSQTVQRIKQACKRVSEIK